MCVLAMTVVPALATSKTHIISFGKWQVVKVDGGADTEAADLRVRTLLVDGQVKEYTVGQPHDVTDRLFVVASTFRLNDELPGEKQPKWIWQRGGWVQVDRSSGRITPLKLANFDLQLSVASWYRDYIAYCGVSEQDKRVYAMVMQLGRRKPVLRKELEGTAKSAGADPLCRAPIWQRKPVRVEFNIANGPNLVFTIQDRAWELIAGEEDDSD
jgi:hypothetical protein